MEQKNKVGFVEWFKMYKLLKQKHIKFYYSLIVIILMAILEFLPPIIFSKAIDDLIIKANYNHFWLFGIGLVSFSIIAGIITYFYLFTNNYVADNISKTLRTLLYNKLNYLPISFFDNNISGVILSTVISDVYVIGENFSFLLSDFVWCVITTIAIMIYLLVLNIYLFLALVILWPIFGIILLFIRPFILKVSKTERQYNSRIITDYSELISGNKTIKSLAMEEYMYKKFEQDNSDYTKVANHLKFLNSLNGFIFNFVFSAISALAIYYAGYSVFNKYISVTEFVLVIQYAAISVQPVFKISSIISSFDQSSGALGRISSLLKEKEDVTLANIYQTNNKIVGKIEFQNVSFSYVDNEPVLKNINLVVMPKQKIALVGETGGGKTTFVNLLTRFYQPNSGKILIDDKDYLDPNNYDLISSIGYVLQESILFSGTIYDNLVYGNRNISQDEVYDLMKKIGADEMIKKLPNGYMTEIKSDQVQLSAGQKQIVCIARAILAKPKILILDEATASVDSLSEHIITTALEILINQSTSFIIAHRLSTVKYCDMICVINKGEIIEKGSHEQLLAEKGYYYDLYQQQFK